MIGEFHFIRPYWLLALVPLALLVCAIYRRQDAAQPWRKIIAPHLLAHLLSGKQQSPRRSPLALLAASWFVTTLAIAGPTWRREAAPFAENTSPLAIVVKVTPSMLAEDVQPSRLARAVEKIHDLLAERKGEKTALVAYAGTAHLVMPITKDGTIIDTFAQALDPKIMPSDGDAAAEAMQLADRTLNGEGTILWITDSIADEQTSALANWRKQSHTQVRLFPPLVDGPELTSLETRANTVDAGVTRLTADPSDVKSIARMAKYASIASSDGSTRWQESGYWLTPLIVLMALPFARRGWMTSTGAIR